MCLRPQSAIRRQSGRRRGPRYAAFTRSGVGSAVNKPINFRPEKTNWSRDSQTPVEFVPVAKTVYFEVVPALAGPLPASTIWMCLMVTGLLGLSFTPRGTRAIAFTTAGSSHCPKIVYPPFRLG